MKCSRCATELPGTANVCPQCGQSVYPDQPKTFSYLPAGAPPWPTSVPQQLPFVVDSVPATQTSFPGAKIEAKPRRSTGAFLATFGILALTLIVGIFGTLGILYQNGQIGHPTSNPAVNIRPSTQATSTPTAQALTQLPAPTSFKTTSDTNLNMSLRYPSDWTAGQVDTSSDPINVTIQFQQEPVAFSAERYSSSTSSSISSTSALNTAQIQSFGQLQGIENLQPATPAVAQPTIGGAKWDQAEATFSNTSNLQFHLTSISVQHKSSYYSIIFFMPQNLYQNAMQNGFQPMLDSVQFLS